MSALGRVGRGIWEDSARTALAAVGSFLVAQLLRMPEAYWATISTIIIIQSTPGAALTILWQRFARDCARGSSGSIALHLFSSESSRIRRGHIPAGAGLCHFATGNGLPLRGVRLAITMLMVRDRPPWVVAEHRLVEVSVGIAVRPVVSAIWPEQHSRGKQRLEAS